MCKKQTSVSHSSTEAEIISLDAGLRIDGIPALDLWDLVVEAFHSSPNQLKKSKEIVLGNLLRHTTSNKHTQNQTKVPIHHDILQLSNVENVSSNAKSSHIGAILYIFEDNEAVIKMIINGQRPKSNNETRIQNPQICSWLVVWQNESDPKVQVKCVDTKHQLADILTKGNFTRDEWNSLLHLFNISHFSLFAALRISTWPAARKRWRKGCKNRKEEKGIVAKSKPTLNLVSHACDKFFDCAESGCVKSQVILKVPCQMIGQVQGDLEQENSNETPASSSQGWQMAALLDISTRRQGPEVSKSSGENKHLDTKDIQKLCKLHKIQKIRTRKSNLTTSFPFITTLCWESLHDHKKD